eukprot:jgi/Picre1/34021/NNA_001498.t1
MWASGKQLSSPQVLLNKVISFRTQRIEQGRCFHSKFSNRRTERIHECRVLSCRSAAREEVASVDTLDIPEDELRDLIRQGHAMKDTIKVGRRGACQYVVDHIKKRWNTSKIAKLHCSGKPANNMKQLAHELEVATGGRVIFRSGGSILLLKHQA